MTGETIAVFGAGVSGRAAVGLARAVGAAVTVFDEAGGGDADVFDADAARRFDRFVFSPGFAAEHPWRRAAAATGRPCAGETAFAARHWKGRLLGVTGTNGKTTATALLCAALRAAGETAEEAGNMGRPLSEVALSQSNREGAWTVCEISSFQAELPEGLALDGLLWTNFAEDHLDRYPDAEAYFRAKRNLTDCLKRGAPLAAGPEVAARLGVPRDGGAAAPGDLAEAPPGTPFASGPQAANFVLAARLWRALGFPAEALERAASEVRLSPHRLARVAAFGGVVFWDDSKATNFHAALAALDAVPPPVFWIGGGAEKGGDVEAFGAEAGRRAAAVFLYGGSAKRTAVGARRSNRRVAVYPRFGDCVEAAARAALAEGAGSVLLSPGFASFDQFRDYAERGKSFAAAVLGLKETAERDYPHSNAK